MESQKVLIIGAGVAGMSAAVRLAEACYQVKILEARNFPGGRLYSFTDNATGDTIDNGHHAMMGAYENFLNLLDTLGTREYLKGQSRTKYEFKAVSGKTDILDASGPFGKLSMIYGLMRMSSFSFHSRFKALTFLIKLKLGIKNAENLSVMELLIRYGQTKDMIRNFWEPLTHAVLNAGTETAPAKLLIEALKRAFLNDKKSSEMLFSTVGFSELFSPFKNWLKEHDGSIDFASGVKKIRIENELVTAIETANGLITDFDFVISTVTPNVLKNLLDAEVLNRDYFSVLKSYEFSSIISIYLWLEKEVTNLPFFALLGTKTQWLFNLNLIKTRAQDIKNNFPTHYTLTISSAGELTELTADEIVKFAVSEMQLCLNLKETPKVLHYRVFKDKFATIKITPALEKMRLKADTPLSNFFIAGDWTDTGLSATIEGASQSGVEAARKIMGEKRYK